MRREFFKLYIFIFLKYFGFLTNLIIIFFMKHLNFDFFQITTIYALMSLSVTIFEIPTGIIADKYSRKYSILAGMCLGVILTSSLLFLKNFYLFILWAIIGGLEYSLSSGAVVSLVYDNMKYLGIENEFPKVQSNYKSAMEISVFTGGFLSGFVAAISFSLAIYLTVLVKIIAILILLFIKEYPHEVEKKRSVKEIWKVSISFLKEKRILMHMITISIFIELFMDTLMCLSQAYVYFIVRSLPVVTITLSIVYISNIIGYKIPHKIQRKLYPYIPFIIGLVVIFLGLYHTLISLLLMIFVQVLSAMFLIVWQTDFQKSIPSDKRATLTSFDYSITTLVLFVFYMTYGHLADALGLFKTIFYTSMFLFSILLVYCVLIFIIRKSKNKKWGSI